MFNNRITVTRPCRKCDKPFPSEGFHNRICPKCNIANALITPPKTHSHEGSVGGRIIRKGIETR